MPVGKRATIADVAKLAGVSRTSVSRVLNGRGELSDAKQQQILAAIETLDFRPSEVARSLSSQRTHAVGIIIYDVLNPGMAEAAYSTQIQLARLGYQSIVTCMNGQPGTGRECLNLLEDRRVDAIVTNGLVDLDQSNANGRPLPNLNKDGCHCYHPRTGRISLVKFDEFSAGWQVGTHLAELGHQRIGVIAGPSYWGAIEERLAGFRQAVSASGVTASDITIVHTPEWTTPMGYEATNNVLDRAPGVTAIWALYDVLAIGVLRTLADRGISVPRDISVVGFNNHTFADYLAPRLTSVDADCRTIGGIAAELVTELLDVDTAAPREVVVPTHLVVRESSGPATSCSSCSTVHRLRSESLVP